jgi:hypothetical protein
MFMHSSPVTINVTWYYNAVIVKRRDHRLQPATKAKKLWDASVRLVGLGDWETFTSDDLPSESVENTKL